jgi:hypothetical protein
MGCGKESQLSKIGKVSRDDIVSHLTPRTVLQIHADESLLCPRSFADAFNVDHSISRFELTLSQEICAIAVLVVSKQNLEILIARTRNENVRQQEAAASIDPAYVALSSKGCSALELGRLNYG